ncbi:MAG TPA: hypothetical protein VMU51_29945 [Mycobacteriales bacterium]|nr:hypothetical protein [Mycobacteriales bacterium]
MFPVQVCGAQVLVGPVGAAPEGAALDARLWSGQARLVADRRRAHLDVAGAARFAIEAGAEVTVEPAVGCDPGLLANALYGTVAALVLAQRGEFALHASTVAIGPVGVALAGPSGAGKSTTALALEGRRHRLVTDDVSPIRTAGTGLPEVVPFGRPAHVWPDTAIALGLDLTGSRLVDRRLTKLSLPARDNEPVSLHAVVLLRPGAAATGVDSHRGDLAGVAAGELAGVAALLENVYRVRLLSRLWGPDLLGWAAGLARRLPVWVLTRPAGGWTVDEVASAVEAVGAGRQPAAARPPPAR